MLRFNAIIHNVNKTLTFNKANKSKRVVYLYQTKTIKINDYDY